jgi:hypothetical protein
MTIPADVRIRRLALLAYGIAVVAASCVVFSLFWKVGAGRRIFTNVRGEQVMLYGRGVYRHDDIFKASGNLATDFVTLILAVPTLVVGAFLVRRGSARGGVLVCGSLVWFLYVYASVALGTAHNELFLAYVAIFSASLFAFIDSFASVWKGVPVEALMKLPHRAIAWFMIACGAVTAIVWIGPLISALINDNTPKHLGAGTAMVTDALDLAVITPCTFFAGGLLLRGRIREGIRLVVPLVGLLVPLGPAIALSTVLQDRNGIAFTQGEKVGPITGFVVLAAIGVWLSIRILRCTAERQRS